MTAIHPPQSSPRAAVTWRRAHDLWQLIHGRHCIGRLDPATDGGWFCFANIDGDEYFVGVAWQLRRAKLIVEQRITRHRSTQCINQPL